MADQDKASSKLVLIKVAPYLWPADKPWVRQRTVIALIMLLLGRLAFVITPYFFKLAVDVLAPENPTPAHFLMIGAVGLTVAYGVFRIFSVIFDQFREAVYAKVAQRALRELALQTFEHIHALSMRFHITRRTGGLSRVIERGVKGIEFLLRFLLFSIGPLFLQLLLVGLVFWVAFGFAYMALVFVTIAIYVVFTFKVTEWRVAIRKRMNQQDTEANQKAVDSLLNFETVKYFTAEERETQRYDQSMQGYETAAIQTSQSLAFLNSGQAVIITIGLVGVMVMAALGVEAGKLTVGDFVMVNAYMIQVTIPLNFLGTVYREIRQALVDMGDMFQLLDQPAEIIDAPDAKTMEIKGGAVEFRDVSFSYDPQRPILKSVSFKVESGQTVAIVGPSGSGKSTIGRLMFRFYDVTDGALLIDGQDIRAVTQKSLRENIGMVPQDTVLFNDTIYYNIAYGRPEATREDIIAAAKAARIHSFIEDLPDGYETIVGERGLKLSGGEKQRVGIARTLLKDPPILLLDEATSALDTETEQQIQTSLRELGHGRTVITIAHRLSTIVDADRIIVLEKGVVVESGSHEDLLASNGRYARMWQRQSSGEEEKEGAA